LRIKGAVLQACNLDYRYRIGILFTFAENAVDQAELDILKEHRLIGQASPASGKGDESK
jgi:hypothetical protein